jgi:hypothetical protein
MMQSKRPSFERSEGGRLNISPSQATPPVSPEEAPKKKFSHEKRVSIDMMPMSPDEIEWAMADAKVQEEEREIQELRERIRKRKEAKAKAAAEAAASGSD